MKLELRKRMRQVKQTAKVLTFAFCGLLFGAQRVCAQEITAIDFNGEVLGKVIPDGNVVGFDNRLIGNINADSMIINFDGKLIGGVVPQGIAIGNDTGFLGKVSTDGTVRSASGKVLGKVLPSGLVVNDYYEILGSVLFPGLVYDDEGKTVGRLTGDGQYSDLKGRKIGFVTPDGYAYRRVGDDFILDGLLISSKMVVSTTGDFLGSIAPGGDVSDFDGNIIGKIKANGYVYNDKNEIIGGMVKSGYAFDNYGQYLGYIGYNGEVLNEGKVVAWQRADGSIINDKKETIGTSVSLSSTATDSKGKYIGRIVPEGKIAMAKESTGRISARGMVVNEDGKKIGALINTGPVFDYKSTIIGHSLSNGQVISLGGSNIGKVQKNYAYNMQGRIIGTTMKPSLVYDNNNQFVGMSGITGRAGLKNNQVKVTPFGKVISSEGLFAGMSLLPQGIYNKIGAMIAELSLSGQPTTLGKTADGKIMQTGFWINEKNEFLGKVLKANYAVDNKGDSIGTLNQTNLILDKIKKHPQI